MAKTILALTTEIYQHSFCHIEHWRMLRVLIRSNYSEWNQLCEADGVSRAGRRIIFPNYICYNVCPVS